MNQVASLARWSALTAAAEKLAAARSIEAIVDSLRSSARTIADADGIAIVRREGDRVRYVAEDAIGPLWTGQDFPIQCCISGIAMLTGCPILIPDIAQDARVPHNAYIATFVASMAMFPAGRIDPQIAIGAYWRDARAIASETAELLGLLARATGAAMDTIGVLAHIGRDAEGLRAAG